MKNRYTFFGRKSLRTVGIVTFSVTAAFILGVQTAGDIHPVASTVANSAEVSGDFNDNGILDLGDARIALELTNNYRSPTPEELSIDPNHDFAITTEDVLWILQQLENAPTEAKALP